MQASTSSSFLAEVLNDSKVKARFADYGVKISDPTSPKAFGEFVAKSNQDWEALVKRSNVKLN